MPAFVAPRSPAPAAASGVRLRRRVAVLLGVLALLPLAAVGLGELTRPWLPAASAWVLPVSAGMAGVLAVLVAVWAWWPLWQGLRRIEAQGRADPADAFLPSLPVTGVQELDRALQPLQRGLAGIDAEAAQWRQHLQRLASGQPAAEPALPAASLLGLHEPLRHSLGQFRLLLEGWGEYLRRIHAERADSDVALAHMPAGWKDHALVAPALELLMSGQASLLQSVQEMTQVVERNSMTLAELSWQARSINQSMKKLASNGGQAAESSQQLALSASQVSAQAIEVGGMARQAQQSSQQGQQELEQSIQAMRQMGAHTREAGQAMTRLHDSSRKIEHIVQLIREIADKINLLSLNAAIEAARAGEHGRGFAVVAQEVRHLAEKTFAATQEIDATVRGIMGETSQAVGGINTLLTDVQANVAQIEQVGQRLSGILEFSGVLSSRMEGITGASESSARQIQDISAFLAEIQQELTSFGERIEGQEAQILGLTELSEGFFDKLIELRFETTHSRMYQVARAAADAVQLAFEQALAQGRIRREDLFSTELQPVAGTNPPKYRSAYDSFTDQVLPPIQEAVLREHPAVVFAICTHLSGYVPTHNDKFAKPLTGNYDVDLVQSRTKRIFGDRTGLRCATHTKKMLLQTYKRDTGEIMHDLSVPLHVDGQHWGGFRMGYRAD